MSVDDLSFMEYQAREHAAWLDAMKELRALGIEPNDERSNPLINAFQKWSEELHELRAHDPNLGHAEAALHEAREQYEGQYERGTYPETVTAFAYDDGGRESAGFKGQTGDCVTRAIAIATGKPYKEVYDALFERTLATRKVMAKYELRYGKHARNHASPRNGCPREIYDPYLEECGYLWVPTMMVGKGCTTHLRADELPSGRLVVRVSRHMTAMIDGVIHDTDDPSRDGTRCVYGYWMKGAA